MSGQYDAIIRNDADSLMLLLKSEKAHAVVKKLSPKMRGNFKLDGAFYKLKVGIDYRKNLRNFCNSNDLTYQSL